ncbi:unnamed protein product, partial [marine sediment metagenome]
MCPEAETLSAYIDGEIETPWKQRIAEHIQGCISCQKLVEELLQVRNILHEDKEPSFESLLERLKEKIARAELRRGLDHVSFWEKKVALPLPVAGIAALLILLLGISLIFLSVRPDYRRMSIKRGPSGTTEVQVAAPIEDLELLLKSLDDQVFKQE